MIKEFTVVRNISGSYTISAIVDGHREEHVYIGFTRRESLILFRDKYLKGKER